MSKLSRWKRRAAIFAAFAIAWLTIVFATAKPRDTSLHPQSGGNVTVFVISNGYHTDIALPAARVAERGGLLSLARPAHDSPWLAYGWGDAGFFTGKGLSAARIADGARALFAPGNPSVIRVFGIERDPQTAFEDTEVVAVNLSAQGFDALARHIETSLATTVGTPSPGPVADLSADLDTAFFKSREHFSALRTCNAWAADQLSAAGVATHPAIDGIAPLLMLDLKSTLRSN